MSVDPDKACAHEEFNVDAAVNRLQEGGPDVVAFMVDLRVSCRSCDEPFRWIGVPAGLMSNKPMVSVDEVELHAPIRPASSDPDFGLGIPGFAINYRGSR